MTATEGDRRAVLRSALQAIDELQTKLDRAESAARQPIAIVGMSCRFPGGASSPEAYWDLLCAGRDAVTQFPAERRAMAEAAGVDVGMLDDGMAWYGGFLDEIDQFDPQFFGIAPREASTMDPQQRMVLETSWEALEHAAIAPDSLNGSATGVFVGVTGNEYIQLAKLSGPESLDVYSATGGALNAVPGRVSYTLGLQGPSMAIDTACSSSLVALHQACQSLRVGESDLALAGGVNLLLMPEAFLCFNRWGMMAADGRCKTFDASADGFVRGEGCGMVVLKRLGDAVADRDQILAVIRGSAVNQDGRSSGLTVPNGLAQQEVLRTALANAHVDPADVQYFEAHGTGTTLGDPIEIEAIAAVFGDGRRQDQPLTIGSVKTNIGHLESAAGIAGLIKVVLSMRHGAIPPNLHFREPSPQIPWPSFPMPVATEVTPWPTVDGRRLAGVSGFGFSGTNAHVVLESPPHVEQSVHVGGARVLGLTARNEAGLRDLATDLATWCQSHSDVPVTDVCTTFNLGRARLPQRLAVVATSPSQLAERLSSFVAGESIESDRVTTARARRRRVAFMFTGQGAQYAGMACALYDAEPVFARSLDRCAELIDPALPSPLLSVLFADRDSSDSALLDQTRFTQPALFAVQYALTEQWRSWGVVPDVVFGHSVGEFAAAVAAGIFSLDDASRLVAARGALMQSLPAGGAMAAVFAPVSDVEPVIDEHDDLAIAAVNGPSHTVVSGDATALAAATAIFAGRGVDVSPLTVSHAFHSPLMDPMVDAFRRTAESVSYRPPRRRFVSTVTAAETGADVATPDYWVSHVTSPVRFVDTVEAVRGLGVDTFVEIGPHPVLANMARQFLAHDDLAWVASMRRGRDDVEQMLAAVGALFALGGKVDLSSVRADGRRRSMPTSVFQRQRYWLDPAPRRRSAGVGGHPLLGLRTYAPLLGATIHEVGVSTGSPAWLDDHRLSGTVVFPATAYTEMALAATGSRDVVIESMTITEALIVPDSGEVTLQTVTTDHQDGSDVQILSLRPDDGRAAPFVVHARATVRSSPPGTGEQPHEPVDIDALIASYPDGVDVEAYYEHLRSIGLTYGPTFQSLRKLARRDGAAIGFVDLPESVVDRDRYHLHPALLDACFHVLGVAVAPFDQSASDDMFVPVAIDGLRVHRAGATAAWCRVTLLDSDADADAGAGATSTAGSRRRSYTASLELIDRSGLPLATVDRLEVRRTPRSMWQRSLAEHDTPLYEVVWRGASRPDASAPPRRWVVVADRGGVGQDLAGRLDDLGYSCAVIEPPESDEALRKAVTDAVCETDGALGVVHLRALDADPDGGVEVALRSALATVQVLGAADAVDTRLWLVTRGAQSVEGEPASVVGAAIWGFGRVLANEQVRLGCACVDLDPAGDVDVDALVEELTHLDREDQIARRGERRLVARLRAVESSPSAVPPKPYRLAMSERGSFDALSFAACERHVPAAGEVEIEVRATGLNFRDVLNVLGMMPGDPGMPGLECAGVVTAVGQDVTGVGIGDRVVAIVSAAFDSHTITNADLVVPIPLDLPFAKAATIPIAYVTAAYGLERLAALRPGERVLIHAAAGGVGMAAVQIAHRIGAEVFATVGSADKRSQLKQLGVRHVYSSRTTDFSEQILIDTAGRGVDVVLNSLADDFIASSFRVLAPNGRFLEIGKRGIWSAAQAAAERPNGSYHPYDLADIVDDGLGTLLVEVVGEVAAGRFDALPLRAFPIADVEHAFRFMAQARHIGKVVLTHGSDAPIVRSDGSYLITGGLGGLGLATAEWLVAQGARIVVLVGRSAPSPIATMAIERMRSAGAVVHVVSADVADAGDVDQVVAVATSRGTPLRGVFHAAGITDDGAVGQQTWQRFEGVLAPKLDGAALLDRATRDLDLDHFVLFSSASALLGAPGQSSYAAANHALDAIATARRSRGCEALSINWGPWGDVGMAARLGEQQRRQNADRGILEISPERALELMGQLLDERRTNAAVLQVDWSKLLGTGAPVPPLLSELAHGSTSSEPNSARRRLVDELSEIEVGHRRTHVRAVVADQVKAVLGLDASEAVDAAQGLSDLGMDSLMAVELSNRLSALLTDRSLPTTVAFEYPTLDDLAAYIIELVAVDVDLGQAGRVPDAASITDPVLEMSAIDVEEALRQELEDAGY